MAAFTEAGSSSAAYTASIQWGDGSTTSGTVQGGLVLGSHSYTEEGNYTVSVTVFDPGGSSASAAGTAAVNVASLSLTPLPAAQGPTLSGTVASFTDAGSDSDTFTALIAWGDGDLTSQVLSGNSIPGSHTYAALGTYTLTVQLFADDGSSVTASQSVSVQAALVTYTNLGLVEGQSFSGIVATFDAGGNSVGAVTLYWGDGTSAAGTVSGTSILGSHTYSEEGSYPLTTALSLPGLGLTVTAAANVAVADAVLTVTAAALMPTEGQTFSGVVATFSDPGGDTATYSALIDWGDGSVSPGSVLGIAVFGSHSYADEGPFSLSVTVFDDGGARTTASAVGGVADAALTATGSAAVSTVEGQTFSGVVAAFVDAGGDAAYTATILWGDGSSSAVTPCWATCWAVMSTRKKALIR